MIAVVSDVRAVWKFEQGIGDCDDWGIVVWHGERGPDDGVYRYGAPLPAVSLPSSRLVVSGDVRRMLMGAQVDWIRVPCLCITHPEEDWRKWGDQFQARAADLTDILDGEEPEDIVIPPAGSRRPMRIVANPDLWWVRPRVKLSWSVAERLLVRPIAAWGFYEHPVLPYPPTICVDDRALDILRAVSDAEMIHPEPMDLAEDGSGV